MEGEKMNACKIDATMRVFLALSGAMIWLGIWLTGFSQTHWLLYLPAIGFSLAAMTGLCPGMMIARRLTGKTPGD
jgi:hypothetical protein